MTIYFDKDHKAYGDEQSIIGKDIIFTCEDSLWADFNNNPTKYLWVDDEIVPNPNYEEEQLQLAKQAKYLEANEGAKNFLDGDALYEFEEGKHIEATDGNIGKFTAYALGYVTGQLQPSDTVVWNTKEDETVELTSEQVSNILTGLGQVQAYVWSVQFPAYVQAIEQATTVEEVEAIEIEYKDEN